MSLPRRSALVLSLAVTAATAAGSGTGAPDRAAASHSDGSRYSVALFGDLPYGPEGREEFPALIRDVNRSHVAFGIHDGDIKNGRERCDDALYTGTARSYRQFRAPLVLTPGDNDWTDCDRANNGAYDAQERLARLREVFYPDDRSLGARTMRLRRQAAPYVENQRWRRGAVTYATLHVVGSNNNNAKTLEDAPTPEQVAAAQAEYRARNAANLRWLDSTFASARAARSKAVMIAVQADMDWYGRQDPATVDGFTDTKAALLRHTLAFDGQVVLVNGDTHVLQIDKPMLDRNGDMVESFTRVQTFGDQETHWVEARVDPRSRNVFTFVPRIVEANVEPR